MRPSASSEWPSWIERVDAQDGLGDIGVERAVALADAITNVLGVGLLPRQGSP